jgi:hypothetical protein
MKLRNLLAMTIISLATVGMAGAQMSNMKDPMVGGAAMYPTKNIVGMP